jgi:hypothetical protein
MKLKPIRFGKTAGKLTSTEWRKLYIFCKRFDVVEGRVGQYVVDGRVGHYIFDVRHLAIHWLDSKTKHICSTLYWDPSTGEVRLQEGTFKDVSWDVSTATRRWNELIQTAQELVVIVRE